MKNVDNAIIEYINLLTELHLTCKSFRKEPNVQNGEKIISKTEKCEKKLIDLKEELARMIESEDEKKKLIEAIQTENKKKKKKDNENV